MFNKAGLITIAAFASPYSADRRRAREIVGDDSFIEVFVSASAATCEERDNQLRPDGDGLFARARRGEIKHFTGVSAPYEAPAAPDLVLDTETLTPGESVERIIALLKERGLLGS